MPGDGGLGVPALFARAPRDVGSPAEFRSIAVGTVVCGWTGHAGIIDGSVAGLCTLSWRLR